MTNFKGTRGKWEVNEDLRVISADNIVADCNWLIHYDKYNALLISKAPELLEVLEKLLKMYIQTDRPSTRLILEAKQLIKEATEL